MQHDAPFVVRLVPEAAGDTLDLLDDSVAALRAGVGDADLEEPFDLGPPLQDRARQTGRLGHVRGDARGQEPGPAVRGLVPAVPGRAVRGEELTQEFLAGPGGAIHEPLTLMTMADNKKFSKHQQVKGAVYQKYDNYDAIEVPFSDAIPSDHDGVMGVPISFLDRHNPDQFEVVGITKTWFGAAIKTYPKQVHVGSNGVRTSVTKLNDGAALRVDVAPAGKTHYEVGGQTFVQTYPRILVRRRSTP